MSDRNLTYSEKKVLARGLNFATEHSKSDILNFISSVEPIINEIKVDPEEKS